MVYMTVFGYIIMTKDLIGYDNHIVYKSFTNYISLVT